MTLVMVKMITGENVLTNMAIEETQGGFIFMNPLVIKVEQNSTSSSQYLPGSYDNPLFVKSSSIVMMSNINSFFHKFYGSSLMRLYIQHMEQKNIVEDIDNKVLIENFKSKKVEILSTYGMIDEEEFIFDDEEEIDIEDHRPHQGILH